jgi:hypothetical protein
MSKEEKIKKLREAANTNCRCAKMCNDEWCPRKAQEAALKELIKLGEKR